MCYFFTSEVSVSFGMQHVFIYLVICFYQCCVFRDVFVVPAHLSLWGDDPRYAKERAVEEPLGQASCASKPMGPEFPAKKSTAASSPRPDKTPREVKRIIAK